MEINVINIKNEPVEKLEIPDSLVGVPSKPNVVYEVVRQYQAKSHQGTAATKTRGLVSGSGRKLWRQKGTGRARIGSVRSPLVETRWNSVWTATQRLLLQCSC